MDWKTFIIEIIDKLKWPIVTIIIIIILRKPLSKLIISIKHFRYKDKDRELEVNSKKLQQMNADATAEGIPEIPQDIRTRIEEDVKKHPVKSMERAWSDLEKAMYEKLKQLLQKNCEQLKRLTLDRAYTELSLSGALTPKTENIFSNLKYLRLPNDSSDNVISHDYSLEYILLAKRMQRKIEALNELPAANLNALTILISEINHLIDTGKYDNITIEEIYKHLEDGTIFEYLNKVAGNDTNSLSMIANGDIYAGFRDFYIDKMKIMYDTCYGDERSKFRIENKGLCLLLAWTNEIIQGGSGWHPGW